MSSISLPQPIDTQIGTEGYKVVIYNNDTTGYDEVIMILMKATSCTREEAEIETWEAHTYGKADVFFSSQEKCQQAAEIISSIGVHTEVHKEWAD